MTFRLTENQVRATEIPVGVLVVAAGAGTGKTTVLAETVAKRMVAEGRIDVRELLVLTFTRKAASEMAERIENRLKELASETEDEFERKWLLESASNVPDAAIETIDAFAQRLLRDNPHECGVDPYFDVLNPDRNLEIGVRVANDCFERWLDNPPHELWAEAVRSANVRDWPRMLFDIHEFTLTRNASSFAGWLVGDGSLSREDALKDLQNRNLEHIKRRNEISKVLLDDAGMLAGFLVETSERRNKDGSVPKYAEKALGILPDIDPLQKWLASELKDWEDPIVKRVEGWNTWGGRFSEGSGPARARNLIKEFRSHFNGTPLSDDDSETLKGLAVEVYISQFRPALADALEQYREAFRTARRDENALSFGDCELEARNALAANPDLRKRCNEKYKYVIVDEYQDINPLQQDLIFNLAKPSKRKGGLPGNLYVVGDERQSIYGFRDADFTLLRDLRKKLKKHDEAGKGNRILHENFRARPDLLYFVNHAFRYIWGRPGVSSKVKHTDLTPSYEPYLSKASDSPRIELNLVIADDAGTGRMREAAVIARRISELVRDEKLQINDRDGTSRPATWGDCAVLIRRTAPFSLYEEEFSKLGIPWITESGGGFWDTQEVADAIALLYCLSAASDNLDWAVLLRSPWVGLSDDALLKIAETCERNSSWIDVIRGVELTPGTDKIRLEGFNQWFWNLKRSAGHLPVYRILEDAFLKSGYVNRVFALDRGRHVRANIEKLIEKLRQEPDRLDVASIADDLRWKRTVGALEAQATVAPSGELGAVTLATIHAAKGREWPLVVIADLGAKRPSAPDKDFLWDEKRGIVFRTLNGNTGMTDVPMSWLDAKEYESGKSESEAERVFYVALTRPREYLILSSYIRTSVTKKEGLKWSYNKSSWLGELEKAMSDHNPSLLGSVDEAGSEPQILTYMVGEPQTPDSDDGPLSHVSRNYELKLRRVYHDAAIPLQPVSQPEESASDLLPELQERLSELPELPGETSNRYLVTATEISTFEKCPRMYAYRALWHVPQNMGLEGLAKRREARAEGEVLDEVDSVSTEVLELPASRWGSIAHNLMERVAFDDKPEVVTEKAVGMLNEFGLDVDKHVDELTGLIVNTLQLEIIQDLKSCGDVRREFRLMGMVPGTEEVLLGTIDLLADCDGKLILIDYKSGKVDPATPGKFEKRADRYRLQIALYAQLVAMHKGVKAEDVESHIIFLDPAYDHLMKISTSDLSDALDVVKRLSDASERKDFEATPSEQVCRWCDYNDICRDSAVAR